MNLIKGKVIKSTHYFDNISRVDQIKLVRALEVEHENRDFKEFEVIAPYVRSMSIFKPYAEFGQRDFEQIFRDIKLHKLKKGKRVTNFGDNADTVYIILSGRVAITYPNSDLLNLSKEGGAKLLRERTCIMTNKQVTKTRKQNTFITSKGTKVSGENEFQREQMKFARVEEAKTKNQTFQLFDKMLGLEKDPKLAKIRAQNPLNNITVPSDGLRDLDQRIGDFYIPAEQRERGADGGLHPFLRVQKGIEDQGNTFNYTQVGTSYNKERCSSASSHRSKRSQASHCSMEDEASYQSLTEEQEEEKEPSIEDLLSITDSPGMRAGAGFDIPLIRDK